ncbi:MAG TPA: DUF6452 family protein [Flavobacterium sp.]|uniref:DUF6452 family protein n=1 Tax=Flavobacterium sp. TaxID=239 RepID=UPI002CE04A97|nr:DUF6452 family protein [Flavobacterium sp.]HNP33216.1 DUF6452 family protein [Flavobacterium sp.]
MKKILLLLLLAITFSSCEKDDICTEETTPRLVLEFYDISNPSNLKNVVNLKVKAVGVTDDLGTYNGVSKVKLPLKIDGTTTKYSLVLNSTSSTFYNEDFLQFDYATHNVYVSRACGYKTTFTLNSPNGVTKTDAATPDGFWIQQINVQTTNIETENETHIKIYF